MRHSLIFSTGLALAVLSHTGLGHAGPNTLPVRSSDMVRWLERNTESGLGRTVLREMGIPENKLSDSVYVSEELTRLHRTDTARYQRVVALLAVYVEAPASGSVSPSVAA